MYGTSHANVMNVNADVCVIFQCYCSELKVCGHNLERTVVGGVYTKSNVHVYICTCIYLFDHACIIIGARVGVSMES